MPLNVNHPTFISRWLYVQQQVSPDLCYEPDSLTDSGPLAPPWKNASNG